MADRCGQDYSRSGTSAAKAKKMGQDEHTLQGLKEIPHERGLGAHRGPVPDTMEGTVQVILVSQERTQERIEGKITDDLGPQLTEVPIPQTGTDRRDGPR